MTLERTLFTVQYVRYFGNLGDLHGTFSLQTATVATLAQGEDSLRWIKQPHQAVYY